MRYIVDLDNEDTVTVAYGPEGIALNINNGDEEFEVGFSFAQIAELKAAIDLALEQRPKNIGVTIAPNTVTYPGHGTYPLGVR